TSKMQDQTNLESLADAAATIPNAMYVASKEDATPSHKLDMGDHIVMWPEQKDEPYSDPYYKPQETDADEKDEEKSLNLKAYHGQVEQGKIQQGFLGPSGLWNLVIVSVVIAVVLPSFFKPGSEKTKDALKQDSLFGLKLKNSSVRESTIFYKKTSSFLASTTPFSSPSILRKSATPRISTFLGENITAASYSTSSVSSSKGESTEASTKAKSSPEIEPMTTTSLSTTDINECYNEPCQHGSCVNKDVGYTCTCSPGWTGQNCQQDINECTRKPCQHGRCVNKDGGYKCTCSPGWTGPNCQKDINECSRNPCKYGTCVNQDGGYKCTCSPGWTGQNCQQDINECTRNPCKHGTCVNKDGGYKCTCPPGWTGQTVSKTSMSAQKTHANMDAVKTKMADTNVPARLDELERTVIKVCPFYISECTKNPCKHGTCVNKAGGYKCTCSPGWTGQNCHEDINECTRKPCHHGTCVNKDGGYKCTCSPGWTGRNCQQDSNECTSKPCQNGICVNQDGGYKCICSPGFTGQNCQKEINECTRNPCKHGICVDQVGRYTCTCLRGWTGKDCQKDINECSSNPCKHGTCVNQVGRYTCRCSPGWTGQNCQYDINECSHKPCQHGTCVNNDGGYECICSTGWFGQNCQRAPEAVWIGLRRRRNYWVWTDGTPVTYRNWRPGEPNNNGPVSVFEGGEGCVFMDSKSLPLSEDLGRGLLHTWAAVPGVRSARPVATMSMSGLSADGCEDRLLSWSGTHLPRQAMSVSGTGGRKSGSQQVTRVPITVRLLGDFMEDLKNDSSTTYINFTEEFNKAEEIVQVDDVIDVVSVIASALASSNSTLGNFTVGEVAFVADDPHHSHSTKHKPKTYSSGEGSNNLFTLVNLVFQTTDQCGDTVVLGDCVAFCSSNIKYCFNGGTCRFQPIHDLVCECLVNQDVFYTGERCEEEVVITRSPPTTRADTESPTDPPEKLDSVDHSLKYKPQGLDSSTVLPITRTSVLRDLPLYLQLVPQLQMFRYHRRQKLVQYPPSECTVPFEYNGKMYHECTTTDSSRPWCAWDPCSSTPDGDTARSMSQRSPNVASPSSTLVLLLQLYHGELVRETVVRVRHDVPAGELETLRRFRGQCKSRNSPETRNAPSLLFIRETSTTH
ncbi:hypothetical protein Bbelb_447050, partial [Branchiostoma belcheri]